MSKPQETMYEFLNMIDCNKKYMAYDDMVHAFANEVQMWILSVPKSWRESQVLTAFFFMNAEKVAIPQLYVLNSLTTLMAKKQTEAFQQYSKEVDS